MRVSRVTRAIMATVITITATMKTTTTATTKKIERRIGRGKFVMRVGKMIQPMSQHLTLGEIP